MNKLIRWALRAAAALAALAVAAGVTVGAVFGVRGYRMYRAATEALPLERMAQEICSRGDFAAFEELPEMYVAAVVAVEDQRFWRHGGVDPLAIARAAWNDVRTLSFAQGGSTISQQLMKNQYFTQEKRIERKFAEIFAALALERRFSKVEILEMYVNTIYFGSGYDGVSAAARGYFGKEVRELSDAEAVMLAGIPNAPSAYALDERPDLALQRMNQVLQRMVRCGALDENQADALAGEAQRQWGGEDAT